MCAMNLSLLHWCVLNTESFVEVDFLHNTSEEVAGKQ